MYTIGYFDDMTEAQACLNHINRALVIPTPGFLEDDLESGFYRLSFDGLDSYATTRNKVHSAMTDFAAGWKACCEHMAPVYEVHDQRTKVGRKRKGK